MEEKHESLKMIAATAFLLTNTTRKWPLDRAQLILGAFDLTDGIRMNIFPITSVKGH